MLVRPDLSVEAEIDALGPAPKKRGSPERAAQVAIVAYFRYALPAGSIVAAVKNEHQPRSRTKGGRMRFFAKRKAEGVVAGFWDLALLLDGPRTLLVEVKAPKTGRLSGAQRLRHAEAKALGYDTIVVRSVEEAELALRALGVPLRARA